MQSTVQRQQHPRTHSKSLPAVPSSPPPPASHNHNAHPSQYTSSPSITNSTMFSNIHIPKPNQHQMESFNVKDNDLSSSSRTKSSSFSPNASSFSPNAMEEVAMPTIDESETKSNHIAIANIDDNYSADSMNEYYSDDDHDLDAGHLDSQSPSTSIQASDRAQMYKKFGPKIKLSADDSVRDNVRYSSISKKQQNISITLTKYANAAAGHNRAGSNNVRLILNQMNSDKGYGSDASDESISMVSQSYGAYIFDPHYQSKMPAPWSKGPKLQSWHSRGSSCMSDTVEELHMPVANMMSDTQRAQTTVGSMVSTMIRSESEATQHISAITGFESHELESIQQNDYGRKAKSIDAFITERDSSNDDDDIKYDEDEIQRRDTFEIIDSIMNDELVGDNNKVALPKSDHTLKLMSRNSNIIFEDQEMEEDESDDDEKDGIVVMKNAYDAYNPRKLFSTSVDSDEDSDDTSGCEIIEADDDDDDDDKITAAKIAVPLPDYRDMTIHEIMNDDIMQNKVNKRHSKIGYHQFDQSFSLDECDSECGIDLDLIASMMEANMEDMEAPAVQNRQSTETTNIIQHIKQEPLEHYINTLETNEAYFDENMSEIDSIPKEQTHRRLVMLQNINTSLKQSIQQQMQEIESLKRDNMKIKQEFEEYKLNKSAQKDENNEDNENNNNNNEEDESLLRKEILCLKQELDDTRHKLLQYEIFDENSELDIQALLDSDENRSRETDNEEDTKEKETDDNDKEKSAQNINNHNSKPKHVHSWTAIDKCIKTGDKAYIDKLIKFTKISMNDADPINCFKMLQTATKYNKIEIVHQIISSYIGVKLGNQLLCHRYDTDSVEPEYCGATILMIAVMNGSLDIANDLLDYYEYNAVDFSDKNKIFEYLNMRDSNSVTLLMKACQTDKAQIVQWVLNQYFNNKIQLKTLIEAKDAAGNGIFNGYIHTQAIENAIHEYAPLIK